MLGEQVGMYQGTRGSLSITGHVVICFLDKFLGVPLLPNEEGSANKSWEHFTLSHLHHMTTIIRSVP